MENKVGRPSLYSKELAEKICDTIASEKIGLRRIVEKYDFFPPTSVLNRWLCTIPEFAEQYARARVQQTEIFVNEIIDIADNSTPENVQCARLQVDSRKWLASKLQPKKYGDRIQIDNSNEKEIIKDLKERKEKLDESNKKEY